MTFKNTIILTTTLIMIITGAFSFACNNQVGATNGDENGEIDEPDGFEVDVIAPHAPFPDELAAEFQLTFAENGSETIVNEFSDASTMIVAEVNWEEAGSSSGWHLHPGIVLVTMTEGEIEVTWDRDCEPRTYAAGDGWLDPGDIHNAEAISDGAQAYATFLGIPDGEPATEWVEPVDC